MLLDEVNTALGKTDTHVYYGVVDRDDVRKNDVWDYTVFNRVRLKKSANRTSTGDLFDVHIIRENFIPDGLADEVIRNVTEINGVRETDEDCTYDYVQKPNTNIVVEMLTLHFVRARK